ncbi:hypothetical protein [Arthrobacter sp. H20]|uniref:hypothetical protein n=1 Tax=Arthrobacter sp. H20 TaxID=1267981 RepID=UPI0012DD1C6D|nr:hypothetical protein [Arthrobacter sp. H20]
MSGYVSGSRRRWCPKKSVTCVGSDWTKSLRKGQTATIGLQVNAAKPPVKPAVTVTAN